MFVSSFLGFRKRTTLTCTVWRRRKTRDTKDMLVQLPFISVYPDTQEVEETVQLYCKHPGSTFHSTMLRSLGPIMRVTVAGSGLLTLTLKCRYKCRRILSGPRGERRDDIFSLGFHHAMREVLLRGPTVHIHKMIRTSICMLSGGVMANSKIKIKPSTCRNTSTES
ncbi:hypothetical protein K474DRAFT_1656660 [Panus rudis PR-1116 ss-1]|nr:hypothetical protein K474DRAFT_1656660 [Panus rudis PR-1116 ss-1]